MPIDLRGGRSAGLGAEDNPKRDIAAGDRPRLHGADLAAADVTRYDFLLWTRL